MYRTLKHGPVGVAIVAVLLLNAMPFGSAGEDQVDVEDLAIPASHPDSSCTLNMGQTQCVSGVWIYYQGSSYEIPDLNLNAAALGPFTVRIQAEPPYHGEWIEREFTANGVLVSAGEPYVGKYGVPWSNTPVRTYGYSDGGIPLTSVTATHE